MNHHAENKRVDLEILAHVTSEVLQACLLVLDYHGMVIVANQAFYKKWGFTPEQTIGRSVFELFQNEWETGPLRQVLETYRKVQENGTASLVNLRSKEGSRQCWFHVQKTLLPNTGQEGYVLVCEDKPETNGHGIYGQRMISEALESIVAERTNQLMQNLEKEKQLNELKSRFVSIASHEFRTPLAAILSSVSILEKYTIDQYLENKDRHFDRIKISVLLLRDILDDFLSVEKLEQNKVEVRKNMFNIKHQVPMLLETLEATLKPGQFIQYEHKGDVRICQDFKILRNIMINLVSNASKFSGKDSPIYIETTAGQEQLRLTVRDCGMGIPQAEMENLFQKFFRGHNVSHIQGTGLGLNIVKRFVELLDGHIEVQSKEHEGTVFTVTLPLSNP